MPREYNYIEDHEKEILELRARGYTLRAIKEKMVIKAIFYFYKIKAD